MPLRLAHLGTRVLADRPAGPDLPFTLPLVGCRTGALSKPMGIPGPASLPRLASPPPSPRQSRRPTTLPPGASVVVPPGVPLVWDARLALARLWQVYRQVIQAP